MPVDRNKMLRYKVLDECFRDTSKLYRIGDLLESCNREMDRLDLKHVSRRTIQQDIQTLQMEPCNVEFDPELQRSHYYRYADTTATLSVLTLAAPDRDALARTITLLRERYSDADEQNPQWQWMLSSFQYLYVHFSCLGAVMPIHSRSGLALLMACIISLLSSSENSGLYGGE